MDKTDLFMFASKAGVLLAMLIMAGLGACLSGTTNPPSALSTSIATVSPLPTVTPVTPTWTAVVLPPSPTAFVPAVPDDKRIVASIEVGNSPRTMATGNGVLWVIVGESVVQIDPQTDQVIGKPIPVNVPNQASLEAIIVDQDALWVSMVGWGDIARPNDIDSIVRIDPGTGETVATIKVPRGPMSLALTPGSLWSVNFGRGGHGVSRIDPKTNQLAGEPVMTGPAPLSVAVGEGSVWVVNHDAGTLTRIDPEANQVIADIPLLSEPHRVAFGESAVWVGNWHDHSVSRVDPQTNQVVGEPIPIGFNAGNIAAGYGNVWVTSDYRGVEAYPAPIPENVVLVRIDPKTNKVVDTIPLGGHPVDVEVTEDAVWVSIQSPDLVLKIRP